MSAVANFTWENNPQFDAPVGVGPLFLTWRTWDVERSEGVGASAMVSEAVGTLSVPSFGVATDAATPDPVIRQEARSEGVATETLTVSWHNQVRDAAVASERMSVEVSVLHHSAMVARGSAVLGDTVRVSDTAAANDAARVEVSATIRDTTSATDARTANATRTVSVQSSGEAVSRTDVGGVDALVSAAQAADLLRVHVTATLRDTSAAVGDAVLAGAAVPDETLISRAVAADALTVQTNSTGELTGRGFAFERLFYKRPEAIAWVMNTETGAPYWYSNWQFAAMTQFGDRVFAVGPLGLVEVGADTDDGDLIDAELQYGFSELGGIDNLGNAVSVPERKRVDAFYFGYTAAGELAVTVETYGQGYPLYSYAMPPRPADQPIAQRVTPGKALSARYWRVGVKNVDGCAFDVDAVSVDIIPTGRRL